MCFVSATAPLITEEQMKEERDMLSVCEQMEVARDVLGSHHHDCCQGVEQPSAALRQHCLQELEETIQAATPKDQEAYRMATQQCPDVVLTESDPMRFLIREQYDVVVRSFVGRVLKSKGNLVH